MELYTKTIEYIKDVFKNDYSGHDFFHTYRVYKSAEYIAEKENADLFIVKMAALLHDVDDRKLSPLTYPNKDKARTFLKDNNVDEDTISKIITAISEVSFEGTDSKVPSTIEGKCVQDADRLDAIGAIGIARMFSYGGNHNRIMHDPDIKPLLNMNKEEYQKHVSTTFNHLYEKLYLLKDMMNTDTARKIAADRDKYMHNFEEQFLNEWEGLR